MRDHPASPEILAAVHEVKTVKVSSPLERPQINQQMFEMGMSEAASITPGMGSSALTPDLAENIKFAQEMMKKLKLVN